MPKEFKIPALGENVESGDVVKVLVSEGDQIQENDPILELETDKAVIEVPSSVAGTVKKVHVKEGDTASVGDVILTVDEGAETDAAEKKKAEPARKAEPAAKPKEAAAETRAQEEEEEVKKAGKRPGRKPKKAEEDERDEMEGRAVRKGEVVDFARPARPPQEAPERPKQLAPAAPSVRRLAREIGVNINVVQGSGPKGRISMEDVKSHARQINSRPGRPPAAAAPPVPDFSKWGEVEFEPFSNVRRKTAEHLSAAWSSIPHVTHYDKADVTSLEQMRKRYSSRVEKEGGKLTVTAIILKVIASALHIFPKFNASVDMEQEQIVYKKYCHIGVAVDTERGLLVPVIRDADQKNIITLSAELSRLAEKARGAKLSLEEMQGGSFTVTNLGGIGGTYFSPVINLPEVAILGVSRSSSEPVYRDGQFEPRLMLPLSLSYDHRLIDGADAARFLRWVAEALEDPFLISLEGK
ncbi:MAG: 2-oxo acid dehydrogenase subunit E2 [Acidobacteriota bacterium]